jgi:hypothetical protein
MTTSNTIPTRRLIVEVPTIIRLELDIESPTQRDGEDAVTARTLGEDYVRGILVGQNFDLNWSVDGGRIAAQRLELIPDDIEDRLPDVFECRGGREVALLAPEQRSGSC